MKMRTKGMGAGICGGMDRQHRATGAVAVAGQEV